MLKITVLFLLLLLMLTSCLGNTSQQVDIIDRALFGGSRSIGKKEIAQVNNNAMAIVISKCTAVTPPVGLVIKNHSPVLCQTKWKSIESQEKNNGTSALILSSSSNPERTAGFLPDPNIDLSIVGINFKSSKMEPYSIISITPGKYSLEYFIANNDDFWNTYASTIHTASNLSNVATFDVKPGEVLYIGDIELNLRDYGAKELLIYNTNHCTNKNEIMNKALSIQDNFSSASLALSKRYPTLASKIEKRLIRKIED